MLLVHSEDTAVVQSQVVEMTDVLLSQPNLRSTANKRKNIDQSSVGSHKNKVSRTNVQSTKNSLEPSVIVNSQNGQNFKEKKPNKLNISGCCICKESINSTTSDENSLAVVTCDDCGCHYHVFCLGFDNASFSQLHLDLISIIGWKCSDCRTTNVMRIKSLEVTCNSLQNEVKELKEINSTLLKEVKELRDTRVFNTDVVNQARNRRRNRQPSYEWCQGWR